MVSNLNKTYRMDEIHCIKTDMFWDCDAWLPWKLGEWILTNGILQFIARKYKILLFNGPFFKSV